MLANVLLAAESYTHVVAHVQKQANVAPPGVVGAIVSTTEEAN